MEVVIILMAICILFAAFRQQKVAKKLDELEDRMAKIAEKDVKEWKN